ncbi:nuclear transport factor 2 family protein [Sphingomonas sp. CL5.1]|uniref:nuclear transport factor 2 family protein n=1 Tax=Sphingomonas sp. CL5.1 TaxID=2653203 RepID=UPI001584028F|nr:nuclear transport factor 2 family protein [Sphingomonas sp. CL5.1]QKS00590.1 nuclear transport factor 2 family protein [Sphingomonas sp. CL5.1]
MNGLAKYLPAIALTAMSGGALAQTAEAPPKVELRGVERLLAMEDMKNLRLTFCRSLDSHDWPALRATMADDFELYFADNSGPNGSAVRPPIETRSADGFMDIARQLLSQGKSIHICTMPQFEYVGTDRARAKWFINGYGQIGAQNGMGFERVVEDYVKVNGKWLIRKADARVEAQVLFPK